MTYKERSEGYRKLAGLLDEMDTFLQERGAYFCGKRIFTPGEFNIYADLEIALQAAPYPRKEELSLEYILREGEKKK